jgi:hypothetical protein
MDLLKHINQRMVREVIPGRESIKEGKDEIICTPFYCK